MKTTHPISYTQITAVALSVVLILVATLGFVHSSPTHATTLKPRTLVDSPPNISTINARYIAQAPTGNAFAVSWETSPSYIYPVPTYQVQVRDRGGSWSDATPIKVLHEKRIDVIIPTYGINSSHNPGDTYFFRVRSIFPNGDASAWSTEASGSIPVIQESDWTIESLRAVALSDTSVSLAWSPLQQYTPYSTQEDTSGVPKGYELEYKEEGGAWQQIVPDVPASIPYTLTGLKPNTRHSFRVRFNIAPSRSSNNRYGPWTTTNNVQTLASDAPRPTTDDLYFNDFFEKRGITPLPSYSTRFLYALDGKETGLWEGVGHRVNVYWETSPWATEYEVEYKNLVTNQVETRTYKAGTYNATSAWYGLKRNAPFSIRVRAKNNTRMSDTDIYRRGGWSTPRYVVVASQFISTADTASVQDGDLVRFQDPGETDNNVYIIKRTGGKRYKRLILNPEIFNSYQHLSWDNIKNLPDNTFFHFTESDLVMEVNSNGTPVNGRIYTTFSATKRDTGIKRHIQLTAKQFEQAGGDWDSVYRINHLEASNTFYRSAQPVTTVEQFKACVNNPLSFRACPLQN